MTVRRATRLETTYQEAIARINAEGSVALAVVNWQLPHTKCGVSGNHVLYSRTGVLYNNLGPGEETADYRVALLFAAWSYSFQVKRGPLRYGTRSKVLSPLFLRPHQTCHLYKTTPSCYFNSSTLQLSFPLSSSLSYLACCLIVRHRR